MKVLIVDDDASLRRLVSLALRARHIELAEASTAAEALAIARSWAPDLILLDVVLPDRDGRQVLRALRSEAITRTISVVFLTALSDPRTLSELMATGAEDVITKPIDPTRLPHQLSRFLGEQPPSATPDGFEQLRQDFLRGGDERLRSVEQCLDRLELDHADEPVLAELRRHLHSVVGTAGSLGFVKMAALARLGESECDKLLQQSLTPGERDIERWRGLARTLHREFASSSAGVSASSSHVTLAPRSQDVLLVGNDSEIREVGERVLRNAGYTVRTATSRALALERLAHQLPDAVVVDVALPDSSGQTLVEELRSLAGGDGCIVLMVSSSAGFLDKVDALASGADGFFDKPVDWHGVSRRLHHLLDQAVSEPARVLYVEDDADHAALVQSVLESAGYEVRICDDPRHFDADLIAFAPDLVLMDVLLPSLSGYDLVRYLRLSETYATLPVLFITTEGALHAQISSARAGGDDHLLKPVPPALLIAQVSTRIERARFIRSLINRDGLTGLLTHSAFLESATVSLAQRSRDPEARMALVMLDIDEFKSINDRFGHPTGDRALAALASLLRRRIRQSDVLGRYGGDEFAAVIYNVDEEGAVRLISKIGREFAGYELQSADGTPFHATFSAGVAELGPVATLEAWRDAADNALYGAKAAGRNCVVGASRLNDLLAELIRRSS